MRPEIYVIHCKEFVERTEACRQHLKEVGVEANFFRSVAGRVWGLETVREFDPGQRISAGHVGLLLGHYMLWNHLWHSNRGDLDAETIILEDDVVLPAPSPAGYGGFWPEVNSVREELRDHNPDWDLVFLGLAEPAGPRIWNKITERIGPPGSRLARLAWPWGTHAIMIRRRALPILLEKMAIAERNIDQQLYQRVLEPGLLNWCAVVPAIVRQRTYDHAGTGSPEWAPSTLDPKNSPLGAMTESEAKRLAGAVVPAQRVQPSVYAATLALSDPFPCLYKGEYRDEHGIAENPGDSPVKRPRTIPTADCARLNVPCHNRKEAVTGHVVANGGESAFALVVRACESCSLRTSMNRGAAGARPRLPLPEGHFNPSIHKWNGRLVLATRDSWGHSKVALWWLDNTQADWLGEWSVTPIGAYASGHPEAPRLEDPRFFAAPDHWGVQKLNSMFNLPDGYPPKRVQVGHVRFAADLSGIEDTVVFESPAGNAYEKNWSPFWTDEGLCWVYAMKPEHVVITPTRTYRTENPLPWTGGAMRGGAAPIRIGGEFYAFHHGCLKRASGNVYSAGCYVFEAKPPYRVLRQTPVPLIWPDLPGPDEDVVKRFVVWPGGAVLHEGVFFVALGIDDSYVRIDHIAKCAVDAALSDVPETEPLTGLRDSPACMGVKLDEMPI